MFPCTLHTHWLFPSALVYSILHTGCTIQAAVTAHVAFHVVYYPYSHSGTVLILICATFDIYNRMGPISVTSRHATLALQMISELRIPILTAAFPSSLLNVPVKKLHLVSSSHLFSHELLVVQRKKSLQHIR